MGANYKASGTPEINERYYFLNIFRFITFNVLNFSLVNQIDFIDCSKETHTNIHQISTINKIFYVSKLKMPLCAFQETLNCNNVITFFDNLEHMLFYFVLNRPVTFL